MPPSPGSALKNVWRRFSTVENRSIEPQDVVRQLQESRDEIERLRRSRAEHLAEFGELATGLAHEIRNPLAGIAGVVEIVSRDLPAASPARAVVKDVRREVVRINRILRDLLMMARPRPLNLRKSDLNDTIEHAVTHVLQQLEAGSIEIRFAKQVSQLEVEHDSDQIQLVLQQLLMNARQAIDQDGVITVTVKSHGATAVIEVADNGRGIAAKNLPNIFRPFFTTKADGTGLGLSLARRIVEDHGGRIEVSSVKEQGTTFFLWLPLSQRGC